MRFALLTEVAETQRATPPKHSDERAFRTLVAAREPYVALNRITTSSSSAAMTLPPLLSVTYVTRSEGSEHSSLKW